MPKRYAYIIESNRFITKVEIIKETKQLTLSDLKMAVVSDFLIKDSIVLKKKLKEPWRMKNKNHFIINN